MKKNNSSPSKFFLSILNILTLCIVIAVVSIYFVNKQHQIGYILIILSLLCLVSLKPFHIKIKTVYPDIIFGIIDNGILALMAIIGGHFAGIAGAVLGGVVGNSITDGIAGIFEGITAEELRKHAPKEEQEERTMLKSAVGKMAGCLLGAGVAMVAADLLRF